MAFPSVDHTAVLASLKQGFDAQGSPADVVLRNAAGSFTVQATQGYRRVESLTPGLVQNVLRIRVLASEWDQVAPTDRYPEKGDMITMWGKTQIVEQVHIRAMGTTTYMYIMEMKG